MRLMQVSHDFEKIGRTSLTFLEVRFMLNMNYVKFENICNRFIGGSNHQKLIGDQISINCHNSRMACPRKLILDSNETE